MTIYVTKYSLTSGVIHVYNDAEIDGGMATVRSNKYRAHFHGSDWHESEKEARERVSVMIAAKKKSIAKQVDKLNSLVIEVRK